VSVEGDGTTASRDDHVADGLHLTVGCEFGVSSTQPATAILQVAP